MPRSARLLMDGAIYHVIARGNNRQPIVLDDSDRHMWINLLAQCAQKIATDLLAWTLMDNHFHLVLKSGGASTLPKLMHKFLTSYSVYFNQRHQRSGHLFQNRYHSILVQKDAYLMQVCRYVHLNPVKANLVPHPLGYRWSNYRVIAGLHRDNITRPMELFELFSPESEKARLQYMEFTEDGIQKPEEWTLETLLKTRVHGRLQNPGRAQSAK